jgi:DNA-binding NarL/FixJ family response regulator
VPTHPTQLWWTSGCPPSFTYEGLQAALQVRAEHSNVGVLVLSQYVESHHAVVAQLVHRRRTHDPLHALTDREQQVLVLIAEGRTNQAISQWLFLSQKTVEAHVGSIFDRLELPATRDDNRRVLAALAYLRSG